MFQRVSFLVLVFVLPACAVDATSSKEDADQVSEDASNVVGTFPGGDWETPHYGMPPNKTVCLNACKAGFEVCMKLTVPSKQLACSDNFVACVNGC
jgi:hypothetical protein